MERRIYVRPDIEVFDLVVERGFAASAEGEVVGFDREVWNE